MLLFAFSMVSIAYASRQLMMVPPVAPQHVYIPLLPSSMMSFIQAPMPYIVGIHRCVAILIVPLNLVDVSHGERSYWPAFLRDDSRNICAPLVLFLSHARGTARSRSELRTLQASGALYARGRT